MARQTSLIADGYHDHHQLSEKQPFDALLIKGHEYPRVL